MTDNPNYSYISTVTTPDSSVHHVKDSEARAAITQLETVGMKYRGFSATELTDGAATTPISVYESGSSGTTKSLTPAQGDFVVYKKAQGTVPETYLSLEFLWNGSSWGENGSTGSLKALAFKDTASGSYDKATGISINSAGSEQSFSGTISSDVLTSTGSYTPEGTVAVGALGTTSKNISAAFEGDALTSTGSYTPEGTVSKPNVDVTPTSGTFVNSVTATVQNETLTLSSSTSSAVTAVSVSLASAPTFTGEAKSVSVTGTPTGDVTGTVDIAHGHANNSFSGTSKSVSVTGTPTGSVSGTIDLSHTHTGSVTTASATVTVS